MASALEKRAQNALHKRPGILSLNSPTKTRADLFSGDFLSLSTNGTLRSMVLDRLASEPGSILGATGSRMMDGNTSVHVSLEAKLRVYYNGDAALLFNSGYDANLALFSTLPEEGDAVVYDKFIHASTLDGVRASHAAQSSYAFEHNSVASLQSVLQKLVTSHPRIRAGSSTVFVALEALYSMDGDIAPLRELVEVVENTLPKGCAQIVVDEAHSAGMYGPGGRGIISYMGLEKRVDMTMFPFSKALGGAGAVVICSPLIRSYLINFSRPFIFTTAMNRLNVVALDASIYLVRGTVGDQLRKRLFSLVHYTNTFLNNELRGVPPEVLRIPPSTHPELVSPVIPLITPYALPFSVRLRSKGWAAIPVIFPAVPRGQDRIRFTIHAGNTEEEIRDFVRAIAACIRERTWNDSLPDLPEGTVFDDDEEMKPLARL